MKYLFSFILLSLIWACQPTASTQEATDTSATTPATPADATPPPNDTATEATVTPAETESTKENTPLPASFDTTRVLNNIRFDFAATQQQLEMGLLLCDTFRHECQDDPVFAKLIRCTSDGDLRLLVHSYTLGDHFGGKESYYFDQDALYFSYQEESTWTFAGPGYTVEDGMEVPSSQDDYHEVRSYYHQGELFRTRYKDYIIRSWRDDPSSDEVPNRISGEGVQEALGAATLLKAGTDVASLWCE